MSRLFLFASDERVGSSGAPAMSPGFRVSSLTRTVTRATLIAATSTWLAFAAMPSARAEVVFGNLGANGNQAITNPTSWQQLFPTTTNVVNPRAMAMGFQTSNVFSEWYINSSLESVTLGLSNINTGTVARQVAIHTDVGGVPSATAFATSNFVNISGTNPALYKFTFATEAGQVVLARNTRYWIVPSETLNYRWFADNEREAPTAFSDSGFSYTGALAKNSTNQWVSSIPGNPTAVRPYSLSVAVIPVPESSTLSLAGIGLVIGSWVARRRAKQRPGRDAASESEVADSDFVTSDDRS